MSLYNMLNKVDPATFFLLPMLGKHPDNYPRFRDCFSTKRQFQLVDGLPVMVAVDSKETPTNIYVLTRTGGSNRETYQEQIDEMRKHPDYLSDEDDPFDNTYALFCFSCPEKWKSDYDAACKGQLNKLSSEYRQEMSKIYPKLKDLFL